MAFDYTTHHNIKGQTGDGENFRETHYIRLAHEEAAPVFLKDGLYWWDDGKIISANDVPDWARKAINQLSPEALKSVGHKPRGAPPAGKRKPQPVVEADDPAADELDEELIDEELIDEEIQKLEEEVAEDVAAEGATRVKLHPSVKK